MPEKEGLDWRRFYPKITDIAEGQIIDFFFRAFPYPISGRKKLSQLEEMDLRNQPIVVSISYADEPDKEIRRIFIDNAQCIVEDFTGPLEKKKFEELTKKGKGGTYAAVKKMILNKETGEITIV